MTSGQHFHMNLLHYSYYPSLITCYLNQVEKKKFTTLIHERSAHHKLMLNSTILKIFRISTETIFRSQSLFGYLLFANSSFIISSVCAFISHHNRSRRFNGDSKYFCHSFFLFLFFKYRYFFSGSH